MFERAGDILKECRAVLSNHTGVGVPQCIYGDILDRCSPWLIEELRDVQERWKQKARNLLEGGATKSSAMHERGFFCWRACQIMLRDYDEETLPQPTGHCYRHEQECALARAPPANFSGMVGAIAGVNCFDWSALGKKEMWLGSSAIAFMCWARERYLARGHEAFCIVECVCNFDHEMLGDALSEWFVLHVLHISPALFGEAVDRRRKYMVLLSPSLRWHSSLAAFGVQGSFERLFARQASLRGVSRFRAPPEDIANHIALMAVRRGFPPSRPDGRPWSYFEAMSPSLQRRVREYEAKLLEEGFIGRGAPAIANLVQGPEFMAATFGSVPALLRRSTLWLFDQERCALGLEHLECQGYQIYDTDASDDFHCAFTPFLRTLPDSTLRRLAGNGMHLRAIGTALLFVTGCTIRAPPPDPRPSITANPPTHVLESDTACEEA